MALDLSKIKQYPAPTKEYYKDIFPKRQIYIHHTASGGNSKGDMDYLNGDSQGAVNVSLFVDRDGTIWQAFSTKYWSNHLGVPQSTFKKFGVNSTSKELHQKSVAIELDSWGWLTLKNGKFTSYTGAEIKPDNVVTYPDGWKGYKYYEKYTTSQINALKDILVYLGDTYDIPLDYNSNMWDVSKEALMGDSGVWAHVSVRESGKWDAHPQDELIEMLKSLT